MLAWDSLFLVFVAFPVLTGGAWWIAPPIHLEYTEAGPAALLLALWLWRRGGRERSRVYRASARAWAWWREGLRRGPTLHLFSAWLAATAVWLTTSILRHRALSSGLADLGIFTNAINNVAVLGWPLSSLKNGQSLLTDHQIFLLYPLGWLFRFWPSPTFLLALQAPLLASGGIALYLLGRQRLGAAHPVVPWLPFVYWLANPLRSASRFDFHPEVFMLPLFLFAAFFLQEKSWGRRAIGALLLLAALAAKESAGPVACGIGLAWLLGAGPEGTRSFTRPFGAGVMAIGLAAFYFDSRVVPALFGGAYAYTGLYDPLPSTPGALALAPFTMPRIFFGRLFDWARLKFLGGCLLPGAYLNLLAPLAAVAALPGFLMLFLTAGDHRISLGYHYGIEPMAGLLFALPAALDSPTARKHARFLLPLLLIAGAFTYGHAETGYWRAYHATPHGAFVRDELLPHVPRDRSVVASYAYVPHLSARRWVNQPVSLTDDKGAYVDCVFLDPNVSNSGLSNQNLLEFATKARDAGYVLEYGCGGLVVLQRRSGPECLDVPPPLCPEDP